MPFDLAVISLILTTLGALLLFGAIALVGMVLIVGGLATMGPQRVERVAQPVIVTQSAPVSTVTGPRILSDLEIVTVRYASQGKRPTEIAAATGVSESIILDKLAMLRAEGYLTDKNELTEKGFEALRVADQRPVYPRPAS